MQNVKQNYFLLETFKNLFSLFYLNIMKLHFCSNTYYWNVSKVTPGFFFTGDFMTTRKIAALRVAFS